MSTTTARQIWVFGDLRNRFLLNLSFKVVAKAAAFAAQTGDEVVLFLLAAAEPQLLSVADGDRCAVQGTVEEEAFGWGADSVYLFQNEGFRQPTPHLFADALRPIFVEMVPRLVLFPLTDFGRDLAARSAAAARAGLIADCVELQPAENGAVVGLCPAWGGEVMAAIVFAPGRPTGFVTVQPHGEAGGNRSPRKGRVVRRELPDATAGDGIRLVSSTAVTSAADDLANAHTVVVGGAGVGTMEHFGFVRQLAAALSGQPAATRPPVRNHWIDEERLIGQTGKTVRPKLLISIGTSGAVQYTAGILEAGTIVAVNRDPTAPIFRLADIGVVADAPTFLPLLLSRIGQAVMRRLADDLCTDMPAETPPNRFGEKLKALRQAQGWSREQLAALTGQTPDYVDGVESGATSPPVAFILRLSAAFNVDPGTFLRDEERAFIRNQRAQAYVNRTRNYSYQTLTSGAEHDHLRAFMVTIEPHHDHKPVAYKHEGEEFIFVLEGQLKLTLGSRDHILKPGESIHFHSTIAHKLKSLSAQMTRCLVVLYTL